MVKHIVCRDSAGPPAGAQPGTDVTICVAAPGPTCPNDGEHGRDQCRWFGGMVGNHVADLVTRYGESSDLVPQGADGVQSRGPRRPTTTSHHGPGPANPSTDFVPDAIVDRSA